MAADILKDVLSSIGLSSVYAKFYEQRIDHGMISGLTDAELTRLGVETIGERYRLREGIKTRISEQETYSPSVAELRLQRNHLFNRRTTSDNRNKKAKKTRLSGWTGTFVCLANNTDESVPTAGEKETLQNAGLGMKKIWLENTYDEESTTNAIMSGPIEGESVGFPQLKTAGGFELLRTNRNCRSLAIINCAWSSKELKLNVGPQAKMYIRPIQKCLSILPLKNSRDFDDQLKQVKTVCTGCKQEFFMRDMRKHIESCASGMLQESETFDNNPYFPEIPELYDTVGTTVQIEDIVPTVFISNDTSDLPNLNTLGELALQIPVLEIAKKTIQFCKNNNIDNPVEILKALQTDIVIGRPLEIVDVSESVEGETNFIMIDRGNILTTAFDEIRAIPKSQLQKTLEVQFYNESALDFGGPRKEFFRLILLELKEKYFDAGLRDLMADDYEIIGIIFALSVLQNGKIPNFLSDVILEELWSEAPVYGCVYKLRLGLNSLGLYEVCRQLPSFKFLFHHQSIPLTIKRVTTLLKPNFSEAGSNKYMFEKSIYSMFIKYLREVASGRREMVTLSRVLQFVTGTDEEPVLGFKLHPSIDFPECDSSYLATANTCTNLLNLPRPSLIVMIPAEENLFQLYDYSFTNMYYGLK